MPAAITLSRVDPKDQAPQLVDAALRADPAKLPAFVGVDLGAAGYAIAQVEKVLPPATQTPEQAEQSRARYDQLWALAEVRSYYDQLKTRYKARILVPAPPQDALSAARS